MKRFTKVADKHTKAFAHSTNSPYTIHIVLDYVSQLIGIRLYQFPLSGYNGNDTTEPGDMNGE